MAPDRKSQLRPARTSTGALQRLALGVALLLPLAIIALVLSSLSGSALTSIGGLTLGNSSPAVVSNRPAVSSSAPPPTLAPPPGTPKAAPTPVLAALQEASLPKAGPYTVKPGDELRHIASQYNVSMAKIISTNEIPNPDSLRVGQVLNIPDP